MYLSGCARFSRVARGVGVAARAPEMSGNEAAQSRKVTWCAPQLTPTDERNASSFLILSSLPLEHFSLVTKKTLLTLSKMSFPKKEVVLRHEECPTGTCIPGCAPQFFFLSGSQVFGFQEGCDHKVTNSSLQILVECSCLQEMCRCLSTGKKPPA